MKQKAAHIDDLMYRCAYCDFMCVKRREEGSPRRGVTKVGDYGSNCTPSPVACNSLVYTATTISFTAASGDEPAKINDSALQFGEYGFFGGMKLEIVTDSGTNDSNGTLYTVAERGITRGVLSLETTDSLTTENAATAGEVSLYRATKKPGTMQGCPKCGSLASR